MSFIINPYRHGGWAPTKLTNLVAWWDATNSDSITKDVSDYVSAWNDLSGNGYHLTQTTGTNQPQWQSTVLNNKPGISFSTNDYMINTGLNTAQPLCVMFVIKNPSTTVGSNEYVYDSEDAAGTNRVALIKESTAGADDYVLYAGTVRDTGYGYLTTGEICMACYNNPTDSSFRYNGAASSYGGAGAQTFDGITIGSRYNNVDYLNAHLCEIFINSALITGDDLTDAENYLKAKWGISF